MMRSVIYKKERTERNMYEMEASMHYKSHALKRHLIAGGSTVFSLLFILLAFLVSPGNGDASLYAEAFSCNKFQGTVVDVVNDEEFTIAVCEETFKFREFSYCYNVESGDTVVFDWSPDNCDVVSFTVQRNGVQCGVLCPEQRLKAGQ